MLSEVADATGNVKYIHKSLCTSPNSVLVTEVLLKALYTHGPYIKTFDAVRTALPEVHQVTNFVT